MEVRRLDMLDAEKVVGMVEAFRSNTSNIPMMMLCTGITDFRFSKIQRKSEYKLKGCTNES